MRHDHEKRDTWFILAFSRTSTHAFKASSAVDNLNTQPLHSNYLNLVTSSEREMKNSNIWDDRKRPATSDSGSSVPKRVRSRSDSNFKLERLVECGSDSNTMFIRCNDEVHRSIDFCPLTQKILDTWPVQRLRDLKQLGTSVLVYPCANHTRFEHSLGVAHLAREMCHRLSERHPEFSVTSKDELCVCLAGLLHDTGHGIYSHLYEEFREEVNDELKRDPVKREIYKKFPEVDTDWSHERSSLMMVDEVLRSLGLCIDMRAESLDKPLMQIGDGIAADSIRCYWDNHDGDDQILTNRDWIFIKECIYGEPLPEVVQIFKVNERIGRTDPKLEWLYDIVSNRHNGIDVDKLDYFARDSRRALNESGNVDISIINEAWVALADCSQADCQQCKRKQYHYQICYPKKCVSRVIQFFKNRIALHEAIYQHKTTCAGGCMVTDILKLADPFFLIPTEDPTVNLPISRAFANPHAFEKLRDSIIDEIANSSTPELQPAKDLARRFKRRQLYSKCPISFHSIVYQNYCQFSYFIKITELSSEKVLHLDNKKHAQLWKKGTSVPEQIVREICSIEPKHDNVQTGKVTRLTEDDVIIKCSSWHQGRKEKNPIDFVRFVKKDLPRYARARVDDRLVLAERVDTQDYSHLTTVKFQKCVIRAFCRDPSKRDLLAHAFEAFWERTMKGIFVNLTHTPPVNFSMQFSQESASDASVDEYSHYGMSGPVQLSQDSCDEDAVYTPIKASAGSNIQIASPSPIPVRRRF